MNKHLLAFGLIIFAVSLFAQQKEEIYVVKSYEPTISDATRISEMPVVSDTAKEVKSLTYSTMTMPFSYDYTPGQIKPAKIMDEPLTKLYKALVKAGFGTNATPYAEVFFNNTRSTSHSYGIHYRHLSSSGSINDPFPTGFSENHASVYGKKFMNSQTLTADFNFKRDVVNRYGFREELKPLLEANGFDKEAFWQRHLLFELKTRLAASHNNGNKLRNDIELNFYNYSDVERTIENGLYAKADLFKNFQLDKDWKDEKLGAVLTFDYSNLDDAHDSKLNNGIVNLRPYFSFKGGMLSLYFAANSYLEFTKSKTRFRLYPVAEANLNIAEDVFIVYGGIKGGIKKNSLRSLATENPYLSVGIFPLNTYEKYNFYGGIRGSISSAMTYNFSYSQSRLENMPMFVYSPIIVDNLIFKYTNAFGIEYDSTDVMNVHGELAYQKTEKLRFLLKGDWFHYTLEHAEHAWHKPNLAITLGAKYNLRDKILVNLDVIFYGKHYKKRYDLNDYYTYQIGETKELADINLGVEYRYTKALSFFLNFYNIAAYRYYQWDNYPTQRFNILGGLTYSF